MSVGLVGSEGIDTAVVVIEFANGVMATIENCRRSDYGYDQRLDLFGSRGSLKANNMRTIITPIAAVKWIFFPLAVSLDRRGKSG